MSESVSAFIGLGSNLENPLQQLRQAVDSLKKLAQTRFIRCSSLYGSKPMGPQDQPDYVNAVARLETTLEPEALLDQLQAIENNQGRVRKERWGARTLDLDLLVYGDRVIETERLIVPHAGIAERNFVLYPLQEIAPDLIIPGRGTLSQLISLCDRDGLTIIERV